jgi:hypothetical protein
VGVQGSRDVLYNFIGEDHGPGTFRVFDADPAAVGFQKQGARSRGQAYLPKAIEKSFLSPGLIVVANVGNLAAMGSKMHTYFQGGKGIHLAFYDLVFQSRFCVPLAGKMDKKYSKQEYNGVSGPIVFHRKWFTLY